MSKLETKLREVKNKRARRELLDSVDPMLSCLLSKVEFSHDVQCLKYAAFSTWDMEADQQTTTRGIVEGWDLKYFDTMAEMTSFIKASIEPAIIPGWFFIDTDGPYYSLTLAEFVLNLDLLQNYCEAQEHFDIGWVGKSSDVGVIFEFNHTSFCRNQLEVCTWGM
ncbi:hypothetical protein [Rheinheimera sp. NSM]|uniref:hypothetical protein n=1 Tax=Rheinheimera sp. NSM TaxID=3457884 RepID=UPI00403678B0